jgi:hypothetical protein
MNREAETVPAAALTPVEPQYRNVSICIACEAGHHEAPAITTAMRCDCPCHR